MRLLPARILLAAATLVAASPLHAQNFFKTPNGTNANGEVIMCLDTRDGLAKPCGLVSLPVAGTVNLGQNSAILPYPPGAIPITGNAAGTTGAVVGTLAAVAIKTTYICGFNVQAIGGTAVVGPITVAGLTGSSQVYQASSSAAGGTAASATFSPCIPASGPNTAITITTTADGTATAVNVNSWGFQF